MRFALSIASLALAVTLPACAAAPQPGTAAERPTRLILFIGDGVGASYWTAAHFAAGELAVASFPVQGLVDTRNSEGRITDSAASATALAIGELTFNSSIGLGADSLPRRTILQRAGDNRMSAGLVATSSITHATPAAFAAHVPNRGLEPEIAEQMSRGNIDVLLGGGRAFFDPASRQDGQDLLARFAGYAFVTTPAELAALRLDTVTRLLGLFANTGMVEAPGRRPTLAEMTDAAIHVLERNPRGFFLMVESSQPDWRGHGNAPLTDVVAEMLDFDAAIRVAARYAARTPGTLVVVTADHETGGLAIHEERSPFRPPNPQAVGGTIADRVGSFEAAYTSTSHTAAFVPMFALGPGADRFRGIQTHADVGARMMQLLVGTPVASP